MFYTQLNGDSALNAVVERLICDSSDHTFHVKTKQIV